MKASTDNVLKDFWLQLSKRQEQRTKKNNLNISETYKTKKSNFNLFEAQKINKIVEESSNSTGSVNEGKLLGGVLLVGVAVFEFFTNYLTDNYLIPYQQTKLLRNVFSSGLFPVIIGIWGLAQIYGGVKPLFDKK